VVCGEVGEVVCGAWDFAAGGFVVEAFDGFEGDAGFVLDAAFCESCGEVGEGAAGVDDGEAGGVECFGEDVEALYLHGFGCPECGLE